MESWDSKLWLVESGTFCHISNSPEGMKNLTKINTGIIFGNDQRLKASYTGDKMSSVVQKDGKRVLITMKNVR